MKTLINKTATLVGTLVLSATASTICNVTISGMYAIITQTHIVNIMRSSVMLIGTTIMFLMYLIMLIDAVIKRKL